MKKVYLLLFVMLFSSCSDSVTETYIDIKTAREAGLFDRGWLPDILPETTTNLTLSNDLDLNCSEGEFYFHPKDTQAFFSKTKRVLGEECISNIKNTTLKNVANCKVLRFAAEGYSWIFYCVKERGYCRYVMMPIYPAK
ncbi:MAG: hypothetical protein WGN25_12685 [Candidatus Electrothrix sp. GW3-4]|uniref:hypothetical protein n=1 Tax=Candidatus Electrothrix sp. GW3-4 TaxID=3126740 RepID=UPI0030CC49CD